MNKPKLELELIPKSCWGQNARKGIWEKKWNKIRHIIYQSANYHCEICKKKKGRTKLECNEVWEFNRELAVQKLVRLEAICRLCHKKRTVQGVDLNVRFSDCPVCFFAFCWLI